MKRLSLGHEIIISRFTCEQNSNIKKNMAALCRAPEVAATAIYWQKAALANKGHCKGESLCPNKNNPNKKINKLKCVAKLTLEK